MKGGSTQMAEKIDTFELTSNLIKGVQEREIKARSNDIKLYRESTMRYSISPLYARYIGDTVTVAYNGNFKKFPVTGEEFVLSRGHYNALKKYLNSVDRQIKIAKTNAKFMDTQAFGDFKKMQ
jgi:hypothetical protein